MIDTLFIEQCKNANVPTSIVKMIVEKESSKNKYAINVNKDGKSFISFIPKTKDEAIKIANEWINKGYTIDVGLMQLNSENFERLNTNLEEALNPCKNLLLASTIYYNFYQKTNKDENKLKRIKSTLSAYNTGSFDKGFNNGYVAKYDKYFEAKVFTPILIKNI